ncbi:hypothetical protein [Halococcus sp. PRR34]|uniref:DUF5789 family protein n=1 Tax=Halococcus sp. PRR34 TaxID=3020830 RepID=UPI002361EA31|nr:hypothetical protein [Halococcus sp. PRR34]
MGERNTDKTREQGVEFGTLATLIDDHSYPATSTTLIDEYGEQEVELPDGTQTLADLFKPLQGEVFDSAADARQAVLNMVDDRAIGRKGYSDRTPPAPGETTEWDPESM